MAADERYVGDVDKLMPSPVGRRAHEGIVNRQELHESRYLRAGDGNILGEGSSQGRVARSSPFLLLVGS